MPVGWMLLVTVLAGSGPVARGAELRGIGRPSASSSAVLVLPAPRLAPSRAGDTDAAPPCVGDVCQPRVSVPGYEPRLSTRGKRTELAAHLLDRAHLEPLARISHFLVATGLRFDFTPAALERSTLSRHAGGWGHVQLMLRWRIDAFGQPVWSVAR